jgi:Fe2+ transport system protein B
MNLVIFLFYSVALINANAIEDLLNKYTNNTNFTNTLIQNTIKDKIITSISNSLDKISNDTTFMNQYEQNKEIIQGLYDQLNQFNLTNNPIDLEDIITKYQFLNELNISPDTVKINKMLENMKKIVSYLKDNTVFKLPDFSNLLKEDLFKEEEEEETPGVKPEVCNEEQCLLDGKCVSKVYCDKLSKKENDTNFIIYPIIGIIALLMIMFLVYKIKNRVTNDQIEYIPQNKDEEGSISYT